MTIFNPSTPADESPELGHEEEAAETFENEQEEEQFDEAVEGEHEEHTEDGEPSEEEHGDQLLAGKYKSVEDLVSGYKNLERQFHQSRQQQQTQQVPQQFQQQEQPMDYNEVFWEQFRENPLSTMQYLIDNAVNSRTAPIYEQRQNEVMARNIQDVAKEYAQVNSEEGMSQLFGRVQEIAQELGNPQLATNPTPRILRMAAQEAFGDTKAQLYQKAKQAGRTEAENARRTKQGLPSTQTAKKQEQQKTEEDLVRESIRNAGRRGGIFG